MAARRSGEWTLTEAARLLGEPQHRLIYLCEKGAVQPDLQDAKGRGSSRRFSARNLLEFAVALRLRDLEVPAAAVGAVIYVLRAFEQRVAAEIPGFRLPDSLREPRAPDLRVVIADGQRLYFTLRAGKAAAKVFGGLDLRALGSSRMSLRALERELERSEAPESSRARGANSRGAGAEAEDGLYVTYALCSSSGIFWPEEKFSGKEGNRDGQDSYIAEHLCSFSIFVSPLCTRKSIP